MIIIGENLKYEKNEVVDVDISAIRLKSAPNKTKLIFISDIKELELTGIKNNSGFSGTMEWGMRNPTFILPTTIFNNVFSLFRRRNDIFHYLMTRSGGEKSIIYCSNGRLNQKLKQITEKSKTLR